MTGTFTASLFRLSNGAIGLVLHAREKQGTFHVSYNEGETWSAPRLIHHPVEKVDLSSDRCLTLGDGRLIVPAYTQIGPTPGDDNPKRIRRFGADFGQVEQCKLAYSYVFYSDDQGETWARSRNEVFIPLDNGVSGNFSFIEPAVVELKDGRLLMFGRTNLGRIFQSYSDDRGATWGQPAPTELALLPSPCSLRRIPTTGDLLVIWNQSSAWEIMNGLYRHRLSCAISEDEGVTWTHFKNLASLDDLAHIAPGPIEQVLFGPPRQPVDRERYTRAPGPLRCNEPTCTFLGDAAVITHGVCVFGDKTVLTNPGLPKNRIRQIDYFVFFRR